MSSEVPTSKELRLLSKSASFVMVGILFSTGFDFVSRLVMTHYMSQSDFGSISLGLRLLQIALFLSLVGVNVGVPPMIAAAADDGNEPQFLIGGALTIGLLFSSLVTVSLALLSETLESVYGIASFGEITRILSWAILPMVLIKVTTGVLRGAGRYKPKVLIEDLLLGSSRLTLILIAVLLVTGITGVSTAIVIASLITSSVYVIYFIRINPDGCAFSVSSTKRVFTFSAPLLWRGLAYEITVSIDILLLGVFATSSVVGLFSAAVTIGQAINLVLISLIYLYSPVIAQILSRGNLEDARRLYVAVSKWSLIFTFPFFMMMILYPHTVLALFGSSYVVGGPSLRVIACAYFIHALLGISGATVTSYGKPSMEALAWTLGVPTAFIVAYLLIPIWGGVGAALGTVFGLLVSNVISVCFIRKKLGSYPFSVAHIRSLVGGLSLCIAFGFVFPEPPNGLGLVWLPLVLLSLTISSFLGVLLAGGFSREDVVLLELVESVLNVKLRTLRSLLSRLVR